MMIKPPVGMDNELSAVNFFIVRPERRVSECGLFRTLTQSRI